MKKVKMIKKAVPYILLAPFIVLLLILLLAAANSLMQGLGYMPALGLNKISLDYYKEVFLNPEFSSSLLLSLYISLVSTIFSVVIGVLICASLIKTNKAEKFYRSVLRIPILTPHIVVALFVIIIFSQSGILSRICYQLNIINEINEFPNIIYNRKGIGIILGYIWKEAPFVAYFVLSFMESISVSHEEAAVNLGASPMRSFFSVTLPLSMPAILNAAFIIMIFSFGAYELPFLLGVTKPKALPVQAYIEYSHPDLRHRPYAMAENGVMILVSLVMAALYFYLWRKKSDGIRKSYDK